jgi:hypothetical protein
MKVVCSAGGGVFSGWGVRIFQEIQELTPYIILDPINRRLGDTCVSRQRCNVGSCHCLPILSRVKRQRTVW